MPSDPTAPPLLPERVEEKDAQGQVFDEQMPVEDDTPVMPWMEGDFTPFFDAGPGSYFAEGGETFRSTVREDPVLICSFVPEPIGEVTVIHDLDDPTEASHAVTIRYTMPSGDVRTKEVALDPGTSFTAAIIDSVPSGLARISVAKRNEVAPAARAFTSPTFASRTIYGQTGWLSDGTFVFPGGQNVSLQALGASPGLALLNVPATPDPMCVQRGADVLLRIYASAPPSVVGGVLGTIFAGPMFRRPEHLGARSCTTMLAGPSGVGKTLLVSSAYSLLGNFRCQPSCITTWRTTLPTLEAYLHVLRDHAVYVDNFRLADDGVKERFRQVVISVGDGVARGKSASGRGGVRVVGAHKANAILLATGEDAFAADAAVSARLLEFPADDIDCRELLKITADELACLPHLFSAFVHWLSTFSPSDWEKKRMVMTQLAEGLTLHAEARTSEHLALIVTAFLTFCEFACNSVLRGEMSWGPIAREFALEVPGVASKQARRVREERIDQLVLREVARALREGRVSLEPLGSQRLPSRGTLLGAFDADEIYLIPDITTKWASTELRSAGRRADVIGRKGLGWALQARGGDDGSIRFLTISGRRTRAWRIARSGLEEGWEGLLDEVPVRRGKPLDPAARDGEP